MHCLVIRQVLTSSLSLSAHRIVQYTLARHLPKGCSVTSSSSALDWSLVADGVHPTEEVAASRALDAALDKLGKQLRGLSGVALKVGGHSDSVPEEQIHKLAVCLSPVCLLKIQASFRILQPTWYCQSGELRQTVPQRMACLCTTLSKTPASRTIHCRYSAARLHQH